MVAVSPPLTTHAHTLDGAAEVLSFADLYREHFSFVWRSARGLGVRPAALDDVVQEIFVVVHRALPEFERRSSVRTWLSGIVLNVVRHYRRSIVRKSPHELAQQAPDDPDALRATSHDPYEATARAEGTRLLQTVLDELDDDKREVLVLAELEEIPVPEIAEALGLNLNTTYSRLRLARAAFEKALARHRVKNPWRRP